MDAVGSPHNCVRPRTQHAKGARSTGCGHFRFVRLAPNHLVVNLETVMESVLFAVCTLLFPSLEHCPTASASVLLGSNRPPGVVGGVHNHGDAQRQTGQSGVHHLGEHGAIRRPREPRQDVQGDGASSTRFGVLEFPRRARQA